ncbi:putative gamma-muurolene synthase [Lupinus albus]|uniref:Putative gamma-muurolene synthase n=1 Tax=Lupinus albus TaxID=3870 RepID=A0A6A4N9K6_LUPAL|nr:putative gamma-muurolene synthase [Lupinus albus]
MDFLPEYMKCCYKAMLDTYEEIDQEMAKEGRPFCVIYAKKEMKRVVQAYFAEAKWFKSNYTPTVEEYMSVAQFEKERGHVSSALDCYMKQYGVTKQEAIDEFQRQVINVWKDINEECLEPIEVPKSLLERVINMSRATNMLYKEGDGYTHSKGSTKKNIVDLFLNPCLV